MAKTRKRKGRAPRGGGSVFFSRSKGCWVWKAVTGHRPDGSVSYTQGRARSQAEALRKRQAAEKGGRRPHAERLTVAAHLDHWLYDVAKPNTRPNTWTRYEQVVRLHLAPRVGGVPLRKLEVAGVTTLWADMARDGVSPGNIKKCSEVLATALEVAVAEGRIDTAPTRSAAKPAVPDEPVGVFTDDEAKAILTACDGHRLGPLFKLAVGTGARQGELLALEAADFDLAAGTMSITKMFDQGKDGFRLHPPKSKNGVRTIGLPAFARDAVRDHLAGRGPGPAFTSAAGTYLGRSNLVRNDWAGLLKAAGVPYRNFHVLRHTHASRLLADGVDPAEVARRIGDRIETVMRTYAHWMPVRRDTAARVDAIYGPAKKPAKKKTPGKSRGL
ncbi:MAG: site-specific integrase [Gemmataceae bacterium]|nr:site-specific integrase [Gemmataceae bacterium]